MSDKRIIELDVTDVVEADDFLAIDSVSGKTRRIKPIKIGATYEIEDGDHEFTLTGSNGYEHTVHLPVDAVSMTQAEYDALTPAQKADGTTRFITDAPSDVESELWSKVGRQTLDTDAQVLSNAVNELKGDIDTNTDDISALESSLNVIGNYYSMGWTATSSNAGNVQLTEKKNLPKGTYIAIGSAPVPSVKDFPISLGCSGSHSTIPSYNGIRDRSVIAFIVHINDDNADVWLKSESANSCTYSNINQSSIRLIRIS